MAKKPEHNQAGALSVAESLRIRVSREFDDEVRIELGQFLTPAPTARLMASMFRTSARRDSVRILDAGAGIGSLTAAWIDEICSRDIKPKQITAIAYEVDPHLIPHLEDTLDACRRRCRKAGIELTTDIRIADFIEHAVDSLQMSMFAREPESYDYAIVNPPYRKVRSNSRPRSILRSIGIESTNLYTAFLALIIRLLAAGGELVMITPRSFCNGPYFRPFRHEFLSTMATQRVHIYESRKRTFKDDDVLQENVIFHAVKTSSRAKNVLISSTPSTASDEVTLRRVTYDDFVAPTDPDSFIHIVPEEEGSLIAKRLRSLPASLDTLGISISTGRVVDFRARQWLRAEPAKGAVPLIYPAHFDNGAVAWPRPGGKKPNAIVENDETAGLLVPNDHYVLVKRFSSKEEKRRVVAVVYDPRRVSCERVGFENHVNYFHVNGRGIAPLVARGLAAFLNSSQVDRYFRQFNGHTQVNASDLRSLRYPSVAQLEVLGKSTNALEQTSLDARIEATIPAMASGAPQP